MAKYTLTKKELNNGYKLYAVMNVEGVIISTRKSKRDYVACTINGDFYFGRINLVNKNGRARAKRLQNAYDLLADPRKRYESLLRLQKTAYVKPMKEDMPYEKWAEKYIKLANQEIHDLQLAYLEK
jgi:hypothetical protein